MNPSFLLQCHCLLLGLLVFSSAQNLVGNFGAESLNSGCFELKDCDGGPFPLWIPDPANPCENSTFNKIPNHVDPRSDSGAFQASSCKDRTSPMRITQEIPRPSDMGDRVSIVKQVTSSAWAWSKDSDWARVTLVSYYKDSTFPKTWRTTQIIVQSDGALGDYLEGTTSSCHLEKYVNGWTIHQDFQFTTSGSSDGTVDDISLTVSTSSLGVLSCPLCQEACPTGLTCNPYSGACELDGFSEGDCTNSEIANDVDCSRCETPSDSMFMVKWATIIPTTDYYPEPSDYPSDCSTLEVCDPDVCTNTVEGPIPTFPPTATSPSSSPSPSPVSPPSSAPNPSPTPTPSSTPSPTSTPSTPSPVPSPPTPPTPSPAPAPVPTPSPTPIPTSFSPTNSTPTPTSDEEIDEVENNDDENFVLYIIIGIVVFIIVAGFVVGGVILYKKINAPDSSSGSVSAPSGAFLHDV
eukprot:TRINITY_DN1866_c0_g1_i1.p1 TRINITY_DN1866_c0_g1~~TRINITY_DN1866_c0_g1_i1.p1  ORF type:complete len:463 (+),score=77.43 TRINITY_DN1866_c0_g1_i1:84-1472(+)